METPAATIAEAPAAMPWAMRLLDRIGERANPILVRIVRQELRSKTFIGVFLVLIVAAMIASIVVGTLSDVAREGEAARGLFIVLLWAWAFALVLVQPTAVFRTVSNERNEDTWDLVELTGMKPRQVLYGLLAASTVQSLLYTSALAPFMLMSYLLRGLDIATILGVLVVTPMAGLAASALAVFCACLGNNKPTRALMGSLLAIGLTIAWAGGCLALSEAIGRFGFVFDIASWRAQEWAVAALFVNGWAAFIAASLVLAGSLLTFRAANRSTAPRALCFALWLNALAWTIGINFLLPNPELPESLAGFSFAGLLWAACLGLFSISEDIAVTPRQAADIANPPLWRRWFGWFLGPGAARGRWAYLLLAALSLGLCALAMGFTTDSAEDTFVMEMLSRSWALYCYSAVIFAIADRLYRGPLAGLFPSPPLRRGMTVLAVAVVSLAPTLALLLVDSDLIHRSALAALSPINGLVLFWDDWSAASGAYFALGAAGLFATAVLVRQASHLEIRTRRVHARDDDRNPRT